MQTILLGFRKSRRAAACTPFGISSTGSAFIKAAAVIEVISFMIAVVVKKSNNNPPANKFLNASFKIQYQFVLNKNFT